MKRKLILAGALLALVGTYAIAQGPQNRPGTAGMGMMGPMHNALNREAMIAFLLPELQSELNLSAAQTAELKQYKQDVLTNEKEISNQISAKQTELSGLLVSNAPNAADVKRLIEGIAGLRAQQEYAAYDVAARMKAVLTDPQRTRLAEMKPAEMRQAMMSHMTVGDMNQMMQFMRVEGMMTGMMGKNGMMGSFPRK